MKSVKLVTVFAAAPLLAIAVAVTGTRAFAQEDARDPVVAYDSSEHRAVNAIGVTGGLDRVYHEGGFRLLPVPAGRVFENSSEWGFTAGASLRIGLDAGSSIAARLTFDSRPGNFQETLSQSWSISPVYQADTEVTGAHLAAVSEVTYLLVSVEALYQVQPLQLGSGVRLGVAAGPKFGYVVDGAMRQTVTIVDPADGRFGLDGVAVTNDGRTQVLFDGDLPEHRTTRWSLKGGVVAEIALPGNEWFVSPGAYYDYALTSVTSSENWNMNALTFQMDIRHAF